MVEERLVDADEGDVLGGVLAGAVVIVGEHAGGGIVGEHSMIAADLRAVLDEHEEGVVIDYAVIVLVETGEDGAERDLVVGIEIPDRILVGSTHFVDMERIGAALAVKAVIAGAAGDDVGGGIAGDHVGKAI